MINRIGLTGMALAVALAAAGCSGGSGSDPTPTPEPATSSAAASTPSSAAPSASSSTAESATPTPSGLSTKSTVELSECMAGQYKLARFLGIGGVSAYGTGQGGDVTIAIDRGDWTMTGAGQDPIELTLAGSKGELTVDGTVDGTLTTDGYRGQFKVIKTDGTAKLVVAGQTQNLTMQQVAAVVAPQGPATLVCTPGNLVMLFNDVRLEFERP